MKRCLNAACGKKTLETFNDMQVVNCDVRALPNVQIVCNLINSPFDDDSFDYILAHDILEHFTLKDSQLLLREFYRILDPKGQLEIKTPNLKAIMMKYSQSLDAFWTSYHLFGGQDYKENFHYVIYDSTSLKIVLERSGFEIVYIEEPYKPEYTNLFVICEKKAGFLPEKFELVI